MRFFEERKDWDPTKLEGPILFYSIVLLHDLDHLDRLISYFINIEYIDKYVFKYATSSYPSHVSVLKFGFFIFHSTFPKKLSNRETFFSFHVYLHNFSVLLL